MVEGDAPWPHGTAISFIAHESLVTIESALAGAALYCPLPVTFNGEACKRKAFLDGAVHAERWRGLAFGVFRNRLTGFNDPDLNFHGLTLSVRLPSVDPVESGTWSVRADVEACPQLELVLPARREAVETEFLKEMREAARLAIYRAMAAADPAPRIAFRDHKRAAEAAIALPVPPAELRPWRPGIADIDDWRDTPAFASVGAGTLVMAVDPEPQDAQAFWRAADKAGIAGAGCLFEGDTRFEGYAWYDVARTCNGSPHRGHRRRTSATRSTPCAARTGLPRRIPPPRRASPTRSPGPTRSTCTSASSGATGRPRP